MDGDGTIHPDRVREQLAAEGLTFVQPRDIDGDAIDASVPRSGSAADRERYVTERAEFLARAHHAAMGDAMREETEQPLIIGPWERMPEQRRRIMVAVMRTLIDKGVLR